MKTSIFSALFLALLLSGCATKPSDPSYIALLPNADGSVGKVTVTNTLGTQWVDQVNNAAPLDGSAPQRPIDAKKLQQDFSAALAAQPAQPFHQSLCFESGSTQLAADSNTVLQQVVDNAAARATADVSIVGHADAVGSVELNERLSLQRAQNVADALKRLGLKVDTLNVEALGKRKLLVATADDKAEARNRCVEVSVR